MSDETPMLEAETRQSKTPVWKWLICMNLFFATVLNYLDRQTMAICADPIKDEFGLNNEQLGELFSAFRWAYAALHIPAGLLVDRFPVRMIYTIAVGVWSLAGAAAGFVRSFVTLAFTRGALGVGEAFNWPCALRVTANLLPPKDRALGNGMFQSGTAFGPIIAILMVAPIAKYFGWRPAFMLVGGLGALWIVAWLLMTKGRNIESADYQQAEVEKGKSGSGSILKQFKIILANPGFWILLIAAGTINPCLYFLAEWTVIYIQDQKGLGENLLRAAFITIPIFVGLDLGNLSGGGLVKYLTHKGWTVRRARGVTVFCGACLVSSAIIADASRNPYICVALLGVTGFGIATVMTNWLACIQDISFANVGLTMGLLGGFGCVTGALVNPMIGRYVDQTHHYHNVFIALAMAPMIASISIILFDTIIARQRKAAT
ncbi:MAG: MFS transporter [Planctomycetota bacterium]|nr:MAG: MFS transporter [Planctomycetota bacterium]